MPKNENGDILLCSSCPSRGDYGEGPKWSLRPQDFHVNGLSDAEVGEDIITACFARTKEDKGSLWRYTADAGSPVSSEVGVRFRSLTPSQIVAVGAVLCEGVVGCPTAQPDADGNPICPRLNFDRFTAAVDQVIAEQGSL